MRSPIAIAIGAFVLLTPALTAAPAAAEPYAVANYQTQCVAGLHKLELGVQVIGASDGAINSAKSAYGNAQKAMQANDFYACATATKSGLSALNAG